MHRQKVVYLASDNSEHPSADEARRHDRGLKLTVLEGLTVAELLSGIRESQAVRDAIIVAHTMVQDARRKLGVVKPRRKPGDRPPMPPAPALNSQVQP